MEPATPPCCSLLYYSSLQDLILASAQPLPGAVVRQRHAEAADLGFGSATRNDQENVLNRAPP